MPCASPRSRAKAFPFATECVLRHFRLRYMVPFPQPATNAPMYPNTQLFINGEWTDAASRKTLPVVNPATGEQIGTVAHAEKADLDRALEAVDKGFRTW